MTHTKAWALIDQVGWCQGQEVKREGDTIVGYCAVGAIYHIYGAQRYDRCLKKVVARLPYRQSARRYNLLFALAAWNDAPKRTKAQVVTTLKGANV